MITKGPAEGVRSLSLWLYTDQIDRIYQVLKSRQIAAAGARLEDRRPDPGAVTFSQDIDNMFYGARQFSIRDPDGYEIYFIRPARC